MAVTDLGKEKVAAFISGLLSEMLVTIGGSDETIPFVVDALVDDRVTVAGLVDETLSGLITRVRLIDTAMDTFADRAENIDKPADKLLLLSFVYTVTEEAV